MALFVSLSWAKKDRKIEVDETPEQIKEAQALARIEGL